MAIFGRERDISFFRRVNKSYLRRVVSEEVGYYKISLADTVVNVYGDAKKKVYFNPILLVCTIGRQPQTNSDEVYGTDTNRLVDFNFLRDDLIELQLVPEKGDIVMWQEAYYEVDNVVENKLIVGKNPEYALEEGLNNFGNSLSITCQAHLTHVNRLNLRESR